MFESVWWKETGPRVIRYTGLQGRGGGGSCSVTAEGGVAGGGGGMWLRRGGVQGKWLL